MSSTQKGVRLYSNGPLVQTRNDLKIMPALNSQNRGGSPKNS